MTDARPFVHGAKVETMYRDISRLRRIIRAEGTPEMQDALDECERWFDQLRPTREDG